MPYKIFRENGKHCVYTVDGDNKPTGKAHGCHPTHGAAVQQLRALYVHANPAEGKSLIDRLGNALKDWLGLEDEPQTGDFMIWKEASGQYRWLATFSNRYRDRDNPPEILADEAHQEFVKAVDSKEWPMPELWHWHVPRSKWGTADWLTYDGAFTLASGTVDKGHELEAERLATMSGVKTSHGMPQKEIRRQEGDTSIITRYRTIEISDLPDWAAANVLTGFEIFGPQDGRKEATTMAIPDEKKRYLAEVGLTDEQIAKIETALADKEKAADAAGLETKDAPVSAEAETPAPPPEAPAPTGPSADEVAQAIAAAVKPILEQLAGLNETVKALKADDDKKLEAKAAATPGASLRELVARAIGNDATRVASDDPLVTQKPKETQPLEGQPITGIPFIDQQIRHCNAGLQKPQ